MRIRITLDIERRRDEPPPSPDGEPGALYDVSGAPVEHAGPQPMGFTVPNRDDY